MSAVNKPVVLNETGKITNQKIENLSNAIDADKDALSQKMTELGGKIDDHKEVTSQKITELSNRVDSFAAYVSNEAVPEIIAAMDRLDIIYYVEP